VRPSWSDCGRRRDEVPVISLRAADLDVLISRDRPTAPIPMTRPAAALLARQASFSVRIIAIAHRDVPGRIESRKSPAAIDEMDFGLKESSPPCPLYSSIGPSRDFNSCEFIAAAAAVFSLCRFLENVMCSQIKLREQ